MTPQVDAARVAALLKPLDLFPDSHDALVLVARRSAAVVWANAAAQTRFGTDDPIALAAMLFRGGRAGMALAARLARLSSGRPYSLERVSISADPSRLVAACHAIADEGTPFALLHFKPAGASSWSVADVPADVSAPVPPVDSSASDSVMRILWDVDGSGILTRIATAAAVRVFGDAAPAEGDDLPAWLRPVAPEVADRIVTAAKQRSSVGLCHVAWPASDTTPVFDVEIGCTPKRGHAPGLRGFFAVHGIVAAAAQTAPQAAPDMKILTAELGAATPPATTPDVVADEAQAEQPAGPSEVPAGAEAAEAPEEAPALARIGPVLKPSGPLIGNVVHFPMMRIGSVPANFVPAFRHVPRPDADERDPGSLPVPEWSEAPRAPEPPARDDAGGLSPDERDAFEHIRKVLGTRPFATAEASIPTPPSNNPLPGLGAVLDGLPLGLRIGVNDTPHADIVVRQHPGETAEEAKETPEASDIPPVVEAHEAPSALDVVSDDDPAPDPSSAEIRAGVSASLWTSEMLDLVTDGHLRLDESGTVLELGLKAARLLDREVDDMVGRPLASFLAEGQAPSWQALLASAGSTDGTSHVPSPLRLLARSGTQVPVLVRLGRRDGTLLCALTLDRPAAVPANDSVEAARREAERTSALKSEFLAKVSHEIRTPLNAILGFTEVIRDERLGPVGNTRYLEYLRDIHAAGTHVMSLVNDLLDLSRIEAGRMDLNLEAVDANAIVQSCVNTLQTQAHGARVIVRLSLTARLPPTLADERSLRQIVLNLLSNAIKFNEPGGQVIVSTALAGPETVAIRIRDTGVGMSEEEIEAAMEPFRQLSTVNRTGSGLGLPLTKALVEANCASMTIKSTRGEGTLVEVSFPLVEADSVCLPAE